MIVKLRTEGRIGIGDYNQSVPIAFDCAICGIELEISDGVVKHPTVVSKGFFRTTTQILDCKQAGMKARESIELPNV